MSSPHLRSNVMVHRVDNIVQQVYVQFLVEVQQLSGWVIGQHRHFCWHRASGVFWPLVEKQSCSLVRLVVGRANYKILSVQLKTNVQRYLMAHVTMPLTFDVAKMLMLAFLDDTKSANLKITPLTLDSWRCIKSVPAVYHSLIVSCLQPA